MMVRGAISTLTVATVLAACAPAAEEAAELASEAAEVVSELAPGSDGTQEPGPADGSDAVPPPGAPPSEGAPAPGGGGDPPDEPPSSGPADSGEATALDDSGPVGANGRAILRAAVPNLVLEVDVQEGAQPDPAAIDHLIEVLSSVVDKPGGISTSGGNVFASDRESWSPDDLRAVAAQNRSHRSGDGTVALHVLYVRGRASNENALGVSYGASYVALFPDRWRDSLGALLGGARQVEEAVLVHELGHLLGLVNLTYESEFDHEDPDHPGHSSSEGSVMYWAIESTAIGQVFSGPPPDDFDEADRADLEALRTGRA